MTYVRGRKSNEARPSRQKKIRPRTVLAQAHTDILVDDRPAQALRGKDVQRAEHQAGVERHGPEELGEVVPGGALEGAGAHEGEGHGGEQGEVAEREDAGWMCVVYNTSG